jgi:hypothetical protein
VPNRKIDVLPREIDVVHRRGNPEVDIGVRLGEPTEAMDQPFRSKVRRRADRQDA